jgi:transcriptional regulator with XRE-family HTH domain
MSAAKVIERFTEGTDVEKAELGERIKQLRKRAGLSQTALAEAIGLPQGSVSQWETGMHSPPATIIPDLAKTLGVAPGDFFTTAKPARKPKGKK